MKKKIFIIFFIIIFLFFFCLIYFKQEELFEFFLSPLLETTKNSDSINIKIPEKLEDEQEHQKKIIDFVISEKETENFPSLTSKVLQTLFFGSFFIQWLIETFYDNNFELDSDDSSDNEEWESDWESESESDHEPIIKNVLPHFLQSDLLTPQFISDIEKIINSGIINFNDIEPSLDMITIIFELGLEDRIKEFFLNNEIPHTLKICLKLFLEQPITNERYDNFVNLLGILTINENINDFLLTGEPLQLFLDIFQALNNL